MAEVGGTNLSDKHVLPFVQRLLREDLLSLDVVGRKLWLSIV